ncbi:hypothetical protein EV13_0207 [Prochlorococcus sp. MIT 0702]|nr:hypothetical protein EV13_0207 [Prochlorococcus sp. MIT 0702]
METRFWFAACISHCSTAELIGESHRSFSAFDIAFTKSA